MGAALGYAGGGPLVVLPAAVSGSYAATGRDIYDRTRITRQVLEFAGGRGAGDLGGPLILADGTIGGLVFAESKTDPAVGYALTPTTVAARVAPRSAGGARPASAAVSDDAGRVGRPTPTWPPRSPVSAGALPAMDDLTTRARLGALAAAYWDTFLETHPLFATAVGDRASTTGSPTTPTGASRRRSGPVSRRCSPGRGAGPGSLGGDGPGHAHALGESVSADIAELDTGLLDWNVDPHRRRAGGASCNVPDFQRLETRRGRPADGGPLARDGRLHGPAHGVAAAQPGRGPRGMPRAGGPVDRHPGRAPGHGTRDWPLLAPLAAAREAPDGWSTAERERFARGPPGHAVDDEIRPAFVRLHDALATEILPATRPAERPGMCHVEGGLDGYRGLVRVHTSLDVDAEELHRIGLEEIARIDAEIGALAGRPWARRPSRTRWRPARRPGALFHDPRRGLRQGRLQPRPGDGGDPRLVRPAAEGAVRDRPDGSPRGGALDDRLLPPAGRGRLAAGPVLRQHVLPADQAALRGGGAGLPRVDPRPPPPDRHRPGAPAPAGVPAAPGAHRVLRGLGPVHGAPGRRDGPLHRRPRPDRRPLVRRLAGRPPGRGHGDARHGLAARPGDRVHARAHRAGTRQHRQRGRSLHRHARPGTGVQDRPAGDPAPPRRGPRAAGRRLRHPRLP